MAEKIIIKAEKRDQQGKNVNRRLRAEGKIPVVVYGGGTESLAAIANLGMGVPYFIASALGFDKGVVTAASYEYGNTFLIVSGLLNMLVAIDAYDVRLGRKS